MSDLRFTFRQLMKYKGSSLLAALILALGIGGTTAVFSVADKVLLNPIPGRNSDRLVALREVDVMHDSHWHVSPALIEELASHSNVIEELTYCYQGSEAKEFQVGAETVKLRGAQVSPNFFEVMKLRPVAGRTFLSAGPEAEGTVVVSHGLWKQYFGGDPDLVGRTIELDGSPYSVIGIMPSYVQFPFGAGHSQFWIPHQFKGEELHGDWAPRNRMWMTIARLREGATLSELRALLDVIATRRASIVNKDNQNWVIEANRARESFSNPTLRQTVWSLFAMMGALLLIACANVGNLLLSRALSRRGEFGVRMAIGAGRWRIARQLMVESLTLAGIAAVVGIFIAWVGIVAMERFYLSQLPRLNVIGLDWGVLAITGVVAGGAGLLFGSAPAWLGARTGVHQTLKESAAQHSGGMFQRLFQDGLVVIQVGVAVVLLTGAGLMTQSVVKLLAVDPGLETRGLYRVFYDTIDFANQRSYDVQAAIEKGVPRNQALREAWQALVNRDLTFQRLALERLRAVPGAESVAVNDGFGFSDYEVEGRQSPIYLGSASVGVVDGDYLRTVGANLVLGRLLNQEDAHAGQQGVVINEKMATVCWPGENPLGRRFGQSEREREYVVIGVIRNIKDWRLESEVKPGFYEPYDRDTRSMSGIGDYVIRSSADPEVLRAAVVQAGREMMAPVELFEFYSVEAHLYRSTAPRRVMMWLLISLGGLGLLLCVLGVYGVLAYALSRRKREVGIRMAMGAGRKQIRNLFLRRGMRLVANGVVLGVVAAVTAAHYIKSLLYGVEPADPWAMVAVVLLLGIAAGLACLVPAQRASKMHPMEALRHE
ncbi:MAG TPA: ADOP family duplicated permease [Methylomirabilota bacterium]|nr:ADOP family duplicated permease [Methylomirabilota bacterium]